MRRLREASPFSPMTGEGKFGDTGRRQTMRTNTVL